MPDFEPVIGLEIHAQLQTATKIFCGCSTAFGAAPNTQVCPVCLGFPGALPVLNRAAVDYAIRAALALGCRINDTSIFARKNYFYPDLPKGYQISQYEQPLATAGVLEFDSARGLRRVGITRVHLEEDAGKSLHEGVGDSQKSGVDFNRSGVPLIEVVTDPDLRSADEASEFFSRLREILVWIGVNDGNMEEGSLRCDANVSVRPRGSLALGTKAEVKNVNSFRFLQRALQYEIDRQSAILDQGGHVRQETRLWDSLAGVTVPMRSKEEAHDYRYFPEPDLPPLVVDAVRVEAVQRLMPELPDQTRRRFVEVYGLPAYDARQLTQSRMTATYFEEVVRLGGSPKAVSNWMMGELARAIKERGGDIRMTPVGPGRLAGLLALIENGTINGATAKAVFERMLRSDRSADDIVRDEGLAQLDDDSTLAGLVAAVLARHPDVAAQYREGKTAGFGFLVGQVMKAAAGKANPRRVNELLRQRLEGA
jgi:aspartyl-tRNA(Asn)/glutamyl-tRNA(Gln) amidotransferase subunit B